MKSTYSVLALGSALLLAIAAPLTAEEKKGTNQATAEAAAKIKASAEAESVQQLHLAHSLVTYGRKNKVPEALIVAARILGSTATVELTEKPTHEKSPDAPKGAKKEKTDNANLAKDLLAEAKKLSNNNPAIVTLANSVELTRGAVGGPKRAVSVVEPLSADIYKITFKADEVARVAVSGDGDTRLDLYIYDENNNLIASAVGPGDDCLASWHPRWSGVFHIKIVNRGRLPNQYVILTN
jgi:hypothetical protein